MNKEAAIKFLEDMCTYWRTKARNSNEDSEIQSWHQNADNCVKIIKILLEKPINA